MDSGIIYSAGRNQPDEKQKAKTGYDWNWAMLTNGEYDTANREIVVKNERINS
jgi:hypothetical protein